MRKGPKQLECYMDLSENKVLEPDSWVCLNPEPFSFFIPEGRVESLL